MAYPQGLDQIFGPYVGGDMIAAQFGQAIQSDKNANAKSLQDMMFAQEEHPYKLADTAARTRFNTAQAEKGELDNQFTRQTWDPKIKAEVAKFAREIDEDQLKQINMKLERDMMNPDPQVRAQAQKTYQFTKELTKFREEQKIQHGNRMNELGESGRQARLTQQQAIDAGKYNRPGSGPKTQAELISKMGYEKAAVFYDSKAMEAELEGDLEGAAVWRAQADKMKQAHERARMLAAQAGQGGKIDTGAVAGMPTVPAPQPQGFGSPQQAQGTVGPSTPNPNAQAQGNFVTGQTYKGKTGTYKYLGGDPKNKANWQKVN